MGFFSDIVSGLKSATQIVPTVMDAVKHFEIPEANGKGSDKKDAILALVELVVGLLSEEAKAEFGANKAVKIVAGIIEIVVKFFNAVGVFKK
jgi:hypothetical protein